MNGRINGQVLAGVIACAAGGAWAQSLYIRPIEAPIDAAGRPDPTAPVRAFSMLVVTPPEPKIFQLHDLVTIIIDETSKSTSSQSLDTEKKYDNTVELDALLDLWELMELRLVQGGIDNLDLIDLQTDAKFEGDGEFERQDKVSARVTAEVIDIKPNGTLVLEATKTITNNKEQQTIVLSGVCRSEDITRNNTVSSSQMANLTLSMQSSGEVAKAGSKGLITRVLDTLFNF